MASPEDAEECIKHLNGLELNGRRIRVDFSMTHKPHNPTPGEYSAFFSFYVGSHVRETD